MSVGLPVTKEEIDIRSGDLARAFQKNFQQVQTLKAYLDATPDEDLITLGYTPNEVAVLKTAVADLAELTNIAKGLATLTTAKDFTTFVSQLWGVGAF